MRAYGPPQGGNTDRAHSGRGDATQARASGPTELELDLHRECERLRGVAGAARGESEAAGRKIAAMEAGVAAMERAWGEEKELLQGELVQVRFYVKREYN